jgi:hypothetical protein
MQWARDCPKTKLRKQKLTQSTGYRTTFLDCRSVVPDASYIFASGIPMLIYGETIAVFE